MYLRNFVAMDSTAIVMLLAVRLMVMALMMDLNSGSLVVYCSVGFDVGDEEVKD